MITLPVYLQPQNGGWRLEDAVSIWLLVHYEIGKSDPDTTEIRRLRLQARREVATLASELPDHLKPPTIRRVARDWGGGASDSFPRQTRWVAPPRTWVTMSALAGLCRQHGYTPPWEQVIATNKHRVTPTIDGPASPPGEPPKHSKQDSNPAFTTNKFSAGRMRLYDDLVVEVKKEHLERTHTANGKRVTKAECIRAVVSRHIPMPDYADYQARLNVKAEREKLIEALTHRMKPSRAP